MTQRAEIHATTLLNAHFGAEMEALRKSNSGLRKKAKGFVHASSKLKADIEAMQHQVICLTMRPRSK